MRKTLLNPLSNKYLILLMLVNFSLFVFGQTNVQNRVIKVEKPSYQFKPEHSVYANSSNNFTKRTQLKTNNNQYKSNAATKKLIASSVNIYTSILESSTCIDYNPKFNIISYTHRAGGQLGGNGNDIRVQISKDAGLNWDTKELIVNGDNNVGVKNCRYPSGVIFNPTGNNDVNQALIVAVGSNTIGEGTSIGATTSWEENYYASMKLDGSSKNAEYKSIGLDSFQLFPRVGMTSTDAGVYVLGWDTLNERIVLNKGVYSNNIIEWRPYPINLDAGYYILDYDMTWANDGMTGYIVMIGKKDNDTIDGNVTENNYRSPQPIILKTTDGGDNWDITQYDFSKLSGLYDVLRYTSDDITKRPFFSGENQLAIDKNNNLHIFSIVSAASSSHEDSLDYRWLVPQLLYKFKFDGTNFEAMYIDSIKADNVREEDYLFFSTIYGGDDESMGWTHRLQSSRTLDGSKIFCVWTDSEYEHFDPYLSDRHVNFFPDILGMGFDINTGLVTPIKNFTKGTNYEFNNFFLYTSNLVMQSGTQYIIPSTTIDILSSNGPANEQNHYYFNGIVFDDTHFAPFGVEETKEIANLKYNIYPNPATENIFIEIKSKKLETYKISLRNILGEEVYKVEYTGNKQIEIPLHNLNNGIYICNIQTKNSNYSSKIIKK